jgi:hypothetical protein
MLLFGYRKHMVDLDAEISGATVSAIRQRMVRSNVC